jgi:hypothetical protein
MPGVTRRVPEPYQPNAGLGPDDFNVSEFTADYAGAMSPFGPVEFPLPLDRLNYQHPSRADRPHRAGE